jgi:soluble lytic murein transglycosylase
MVDLMLNRVLRRHIGGLMGLLMVGALAQGASAESIYRYVDHNGVIHFSNAPTDSRYEKVQERVASQVRTDPSVVPVPTILSEKPAPVRETIYQFVDKNGVVHFSNVPTNPRYKKIRGERTLSRLRPTLPSLKLHETILLNSHKHSLSPALVHAVIRAESAYDPNARSSKGAMGLMQLMPGTASLLRVSNPYNPDENVSGGARYLRHLLDRFGGNLELALAAYNAGESRVSRESRIPRISETQQYVRKVIRFYRDLSREGINSRPTRTFDAATPPLVTRRFVNHLSPN